jgi:UDP-glucose 4-epimerase
MMERLAATVDGVCHLAALTRIRESFARPGEYFSVNAAGTAAVVSALLCAAAAQGRPGRLVLASTAAVYGQAPHSPIAESTPVVPLSPYGASKVAAEGMALSAASHGGLGVTVLRAFNVAGAVDGRTDTDLTRIIPKALAVARGLEPVLEVNGDGSAVRDYVHVDDLARAFVLALEQSSPGEGAVYNVGATAASVASVIESVSRVSGGGPIPVKHLPPKPEAASVLADTARIRAELGWEPRRSGLDEIVADAWAAGR